MNKQALQRYSATTAMLAIAGTFLAACQPSGSAPTAQEQFAGVWLIDKPVVALRTADGGEPPLRPEAASVYAQRQAARKKGDTTFDGATWCSSLGMPRMLQVNSPFEIVVRPKHVAFLHEWNWWARIVYLPGALDKDATAPPPPGIPGGGGPPGAAPPSAGPPGAGPPGAGPPGAPPSGPPPSADSGEPEPGSTGLALGKWDGNSLVIATDHLTDNTLIDNAGMPHSGALRLTEKLRLLSPDVLEDRIRLEDAATFTQPWETVLTFKRQADGSRREDVCLDRIKAGEPAVKE